MDCTRPDLETIERAKYVQLDDGTFAKRIVLVNEQGEELGCEKPVSTQTLRLGGSVEVAPGQWADKVIVVDE